MDRHKKGHHSILVYFLLSGILLGAFAIRYKGITFGLPLPTHPDETIIMRNVRAMVHRGDANPHFFNYPSLFLYMQAAVYRAVDASGGTAGTRGRLQDGDVSTIFLAGRSLTLLLSLATLLAVFFIGRLLFDRGTGVAATLILAACSLHVSNSVYITVDSPMTFWVMLSFLQAVLIFERGPRWIYYILGAVFAGLAVGTKYTAFLVFLPLAFAHFHAHPFSWKALFHRKLLVASLLVVLAFLATTPYALLDFQNFIQAIRFESSHYSRGHLGAAADSVSYLQYGGLLLQGFGLWLTLVALGAAVRLLFLEHRRGILCLLYPLSFFLYIGMFRTYFSRNLLSLTPFLALLAAFGALRASRYLLRAAKQGLPPRHWPAGAASALAIVLAGVGLWQQGFLSYHQVSESILTDTRLEAKRWIMANLPKGARIACGKYAPLLDRKWFQVRNFGFKASLKREAKLNRFDYIITSSLSYNRYYRDRKKYKKYIDFHERLFASYLCIKEFAPDGVRTTGPTIKILKVMKK
jgi:4-amino-4-deoxy-L-arabinose transferase-like glycosyltransferase